MTRRAWRRFVLALTVACALGGVAPAMIALADHGWRSWLDVTEFQEGRAAND